MGYIHCCGGLRKTRSFRLVPLQNFVLCELDYLKKCPKCGATSVQLTRIDKENNIQELLSKINNQFNSDIINFGYKNKGGNK